MFFGFLKKLLIIFENSHGHGQDIIGKDIIFFYGHGNVPIVSRTRPGHVPIVFFYVPMMSRWCHVTVPLSVTGTEELLY